MFASVAAALLALAANVTLLTASAWLIASAAFHPHLSTLALGITAVRAAGILRAVFRYLERLTTHSATLNALNQIRVKLYRAALSKATVNIATLHHDLIVTSDTKKDFLPRVVIPIVGAVTINIVATVIVFRTVGVIALLIPAALLVTVLIARNVNETEIDDSQYRRKLLDFNDGRDEIAIADSFDRVQSTLDKHAEKLSIVDDKIINCNSICSIINVAAMCVVMWTMIDCVGVIDFAVKLFVLLINFEMSAAIVGSVRWRAR